MISRKVAAGFFGLGFALMIAAVGCRPGGDSGGGSGSGSGGGIADYVGTWSMTSTVTSHSGTCTAMSPISIAIDSNGNMTWSSGAVNIAGVMDSSGTFSGGYTDTTHCGDGIISGSCPTTHRCTGTIDTTAKPGTDGSYKVAVTLAR